MTKQLMGVDGKVLNVGDVGDLSDDGLLDLIEAVEAEIKHRIGRCELCGERHDSFKICRDRLRRDPSPVREQESDFEAAFRRRKR